MAYNLYETSPKWQPRRGLEGPFTYPNGQVLYYDPREGKYWDPTTDFFVDHDEVLDLMAPVFQKLS